MTGRRAFTLVEVMMAIGIAGMIMTAGLAPVIYTTRLISETQRSFRADNTERKVVKRLFQDARETTSMNALTQVRIIRQDNLAAGGNDILMLWTVTPSYSGRPAGSVVYGLARESVMKMDTPKGLYRWVVSKDIYPDNVTMDDLDKSKPELVLPGVTGLRFSVFEGGRWFDEYKGGVPQALRVKLDFDGREKTYESWLPRL